MITTEELKARAERFARSLTVGERDDVVKVLRDQYVAGFMQGYTCAGGIVGVREAEQLRDCEPEERGEPI